MVISARDEQTQMQMPPHQMEIVGLLLEHGDSLQSSFGGIFTSLYEMCFFQFDSALCM